MYLYGVVEPHTQEPISCVLESQSVHFSKVFSKEHGWYFFSFARFSSLSRVAVHFKFEACLYFNSGGNHMHGALFETALAQLEHFVAHYFVFPLIVGILFIISLVHDLIGF